MKNLLVLDGGKISVSATMGLVVDNNVIIDVPKQAFLQVKKSKDFLDEHLRSKIVYGINTGFGPMASHVIAKKLLINLQYNLIRSHAAGMGEPIDQKFVLAAMVIRLNTLLKGYSGVSTELLGKLRDFINYRIIPVVPEHGAVGTSGDLVQLAHIALALIGEGEVYFGGRRRLTKEVLIELQIKPHKLQPKEGLALINGTSLMTGVASSVVIDAKRLLDLAVRSGSMALELLRGFSDSISERLHSVRPHPGQKEVARLMRQILSSSKLLQDRRVFQRNNIPDQESKVIVNGVQEVYSVRCIPQILGPIFDTLQKTRQEVETEINSVTDNPIIDVDDELFLHGGNFHGDYIAASIDQLKAALVKLTMLSERRINYFLNDKLNKLFPAFLNLHTPGLTLGLQGLQFVATSTTAQSQSLAYPHHLHSIPTNGDNQDVVSMGTDAALFAAKVADNAFTVLAIELVTLTQAVDFLNNVNQLSESSRQLYKEVRQYLAVVRDDRPLSIELRALVRHLKTGSSTVTL